MRTCYLDCFDGVAWFLGLTSDFAEGIGERFNGQLQVLDYSVVMGEAISA